MTSSIRTLTVYGLFEPNTHIRVLVDGAVCKDGLVDSPALYSFTTSVELHGKVVVDIQVLSGSITLGNTTATYPCVFNNIHKGTLTFDQPIRYPMIQYDGQVPTAIEPYTVTITDKFVYDHLMFNGPDEMQIITEPLGSYDNVMAGNIFTCVERGVFKSYDAYYNASRVVQKHYMDVLLKSLYNSGD